jgi:hypothetical protein
MTCLKEEVAASAAALLVRPADDVVDKLFSEAGEFTAACVALAVTALLFRGNEAAESEMANNDSFIRSDSQISNGGLPLFIDQSRRKLRQEFQSIILSC